MQLAVYFVRFIFFFLLVIYTSSWQPSSCKPFPYTCGSKTFNVSFPFQIYGRPNSCGNPSYNVICRDATSTLVYNTSSGYSHITSIDYTNTLLSVINPDFTGQSCPQPYSYTNMDTSLYQISDRDTNMTLHTNCTSPFPNLPSIPCLERKTGQRWFYTFNETEQYCYSVVLVPLSQEAAGKFVDGSWGFGQALQKGFSLKWTIGMGWCSDCVRSGGSCGYYNGSMDQPACFCPNGMSVHSCPKDDLGKSGVKGKIIIGACMGSGIFIIGSIIMILWFRSHRRISEVFGYKRKANHARTIEAFLEKYGSLATKRYSYSSLKKMTKSFSEKLGQGGYGSVYKGKLFDGHQVAVKILSETKGNGEDFINEVAAIGNTSHVNVVTLRGFCVEGAKRALIYDFMPNGSLEKYIYLEKLQTEQSLGWEKLYKIAVGIARGLEYLHRGCNTRIVHFDIKPHNILLDKDFCPKISDFGMAKLCPPKQSIISMYGARGTIGYIAPEIFSRTFGAVSSKSDVYSYGMMLLDMFGGKKRTDAKSESASEDYFPQSIYRHLDNNRDDIDLTEFGATGETEEIARKIMIVAFWCIQTMPENRPSTSRMVEMLEGSIDDLPIPPKPVLSSPLDLIVCSTLTANS